MLTQARERGAGQERRKSLNLHSVSNLKCWAPYSPSCLTQLRQSVIQIYRLLESKPQNTVIMSRCPSYPHLFSARSPSSHFCLLRRKEISSKGTWKKQEQNRRQHWRASSYRPLHRVHLRGREAIKQRTERVSVPGAAMNSFNSPCTELLYTAVRATAASSHSLCLCAAHCHHQQHWLFERVLLSPMPFEGLQSCFWTEDWCKSF